MYLDFPTHLLQMRMMGDPTTEVGGD